MSKAWSERALEYVPSPKSKFSLHSPLADTLGPSTLLCLCLLLNRTLWAGPVWCSSLLTVLPEKTASATPFGLSRASQSESSLRNQRFILSVPTPPEIDRLNYYAGMIEHLRFDESDAAHPWLSVQLKFPKLKIIEYVVPSPLPSSMIPKVLADTIVCSFAGPGLSLCLIWRLC